MLLIFLLYFFQECFKKYWRTHKNLHLLAGLLAGLLLSQILEGKCIVPTSELDSIFDGYRFTGSLRPSKKVHLFSATLKHMLRLHLELFRIIFNDLTMQILESPFRNARPKALTQL